MMKTRYLAGLAALAVLAGTIGLFVTHGANAQDTKKPIEVALKDIHGKTVKLSDYRGKVVIVDVWATWCGYCVREIPDLVAVQEDAITNKKPLRVIGISVDKDKDAVVKFAKEHSINYAVLYGDKAGLKPFGDIYGLPTKFIVNKKGVIVDKITGAVAKEELLRRVEPHLK